MNNNQGKLNMDGIVKGFKSDFSLSIGSLNTKNERVENENGKLNTKKFQHNKLENVNLKMSAAADECSITMILEYVENIKETIKNNIKDSFEEEEVKPEVEKEQIENQAVILKKRLEEIELENKKLKEERKRVKKEMLEIIKEKEENNKKEEDGIIPLPNDEEEDPWI